jgi:hypothetical protein
MTFSVYVEAGQSNQPNCVKISFGAAVRAVELHQNRIG